jgi:hypothetical protein
LVAISYLLRIRIRSIIVFGTTEEPAYSKLHQSWRKNGFRPVLKTFNFDGTMKLLVVGSSALRSRGIE